MTDGGKRALAGAAGGLVNGVFGGGGGQVLLPLLTHWGGVEQKRAFATCVAVVLPMTCLSAGIYLWQTAPPLGQVLPYLVGGLIGGFLGGATFRRVPVGVLRTIFGVFMLYAGVRYLL